MTPTILVMRIWYCHDCNHVMTGVTIVEAKEVCRDCNSENGKEFGLSWEQFYRELLAGKNKEGSRSSWHIPLKEFEEKLFEILL